VGSGKTALLLACAGCFATIQPRGRDQRHLTQEDAGLVNHETLPAERITAGDRRLPHTAVRGDISQNDALRRLMRKFKPQLLRRGGGDNLAAQFSRELSTSPST
jgi:Ni2+-binding GTPase involved in maturation of urease and hydrogenase